MEACPSLLGASLRPMLATLSTESPRDSGALTLSAVELSTMKTEGLSSVVLASSHWRLTGKG